MVPGIDLADHHPNPTCAVSDDPKTDSFVLTALRRVEKGESLTIDYGPLSSAELLSDYGFTVDNNAHDKIALNCDYNLIHLARLVTGQAGNNEDAGGALLPSAPSSTSVEETGLPVSVIGRGGHKLDDRWLHQWQVYWLSALNLYGPTAHHSTLITAPTFLSSLLFSS